MKSRTLSKRTPFLHHHNVIKFHKSIVVVHRLIAICAVLHKRFFLLALLFCFLLVLKNSYTKVKIIEQSKTLITFKKLHRFFFMVSFTEKIFLPLIATQLFRLPARRRSNAKRRINIATRNESSKHKESSEQVASMFFILNKYMCERWSKGNLRYLRKLL